MVNKPVATGYNIVKDIDYDKFNLERDGYIKCLGEDCVKGFINQLLEIEAYMKIYFNIEIEIDLDTVSEFMIKLLVGSVKKNLDHCHLTAKFRGLAHNNSNLNTQKAYTSFVPRSIHNFQDSVVI